MSIKHAIRTAAVALGLAVMAGPALAADAYTTSDLNLRAGPGTDYPRIGIIGDNTLVNVQGCLNGWSWCDVIIEGDRGWVSGRGLVLARNEGRIYFRDEAPRLGVPVITFNVDRYWGDNYRDRRFYRDRDRWHDGHRGRDRDRNWDRDRRRWDDDRRYR